MPFIRPQAVEWPATTSRQPPASDSPANVGGGTRHGAATEGSSAGSCPHPSWPTALLPLHECRANRRKPVSKRGAMQKCTGSICNSGRYRTQPHRACTVSYSTHQHQADASSNLMPHAKPCPALMLLQGPTAARGSGMLLDCAVPAPSKPSPEKSLPQQPAVPSCWMPQVKVSAMPVVKLA